MCVGTVVNDVVVKCVYGEWFHLECVEQYCHTHKIAVELDSIDSQDFHCPWCMWNSVLEKEYENKCAEDVLINSLHSRDTK